MLLFMLHSVLDNPTGIIFEIKFHVTFYTALRLRDLKSFNLHCNQPLEARYNVTIFAAPNHEHLNSYQPFRILKYETK